MFCVRSEPQPKFAAFHPKKLPASCEQLGVVERAPTSDDRIAFEIHIDPAVLRFLEQLRVRSHGVLIGPRRRPVGWSVGGRVSGGSRLCASLHRSARALQLASAVRRQPKKQRCGDYSRIHGRSARGEATSMPT